MYFSRGFVLVAVLATNLSCISTVSYAETVKLALIDQSGKPVSNAVVSAHAQNKASHSPGKLEKTIIIDQIDKEFINHVTPIQVGTAVNFPNHDQIRHHVYSLSSVKTFEIPLYKGIPADSIIFEQAGIVALGCNIHDHMSAYIVVIDSPYFAITNEQGYTSLTLPVGEYELRFWHRDADQQSKNSKQSVKVIEGIDDHIKLKLTIKPSWISRRPFLSNRNRGRYR